MAIRALSFLLPVVVVAAAIFAQQTASVDPESAAAGAAGATPPAAAGEGGQAILMQYVESRTTSITVKWTVNSTSSTSSSHHDFFQVLALSLNSGIVLVARPTNETEFTLTDLTVDTPYKVCVVAAKPSRSSVAALGVLEDSSDPDDDDQHHKSCLLASTIPYVRLDSVLVFLGVIGFIALLILAAVICWKRSTHSEDPGSAAATDEDIENGLTAPGTAAADPGFEEKKGLDEEQPLLDSDNNQYPPQKNSEQPVPEVKVESDVEPVIVSDHHHEKSELPADGQADKPIPV